MQRGVLFVLVFLLAGCLSDAGPSETTSPPGPSVPLATGAPSALEDNRSRTLAEPPVWRLGEWWKIRLTDAFIGATYETMRVVGGVEGDDYIVGMPKDAFSNDLMVLHLPGYGEVDRSDLSFEIHDRRYEPLRFPLKEGDTWTTEFEGRPVTARVHVEAPNRARIQMDGTTDHINVTYDAGIGEIVKHADANYATYEIIDHGYDYRGTIEVPHAHDLIFQDVRFVGAFRSLDPPVVAPPMTEIEVAKDYDRVSFALLGGDIVGSVDPSVHSRSTGYYKLDAFAPKGEQFTVEIKPGDPAFVLRFFEEHDPSGKWRFEHTVVGPGFMVAEGIAYHVWDVDLPSGERRTTDNQHTHNH